MYTRDAVYILSYVVLQIAVSVQKVWRGAASCTVTKKVTPSGRRRGRTREEVES